MGISRDITERKQAEQALLLRNRELEALLYISSTLIRPGSFTEKRSAVLEELARIADADRVNLWQPDESQQGLRLVAAVGPAFQPTPQMLFLSPNVGVSGLAFEQGSSS